MHTFKFSVASFYLLGIANAQKILPVQDLSPRAYSVMLNAPGFNGLYENKYKCANQEWVRADGNWPTNNPDVSGTAYHYLTHEECVGACAARDDCWGFSYSKKVNDYDEMACSYFVYGSPYGTVGPEADPHANFHGWRKCACGLLIGECDSSEMSERQDTNIHQLYRPISVQPFQTRAYCKPYPLNGVVQHGVNCKDARGYSLSITDYTIPKVTAEKCEEKCNVWNSAMDEHDPHGKACSHFASEDGGDKCILYSGCDEFETDSNFVIYEQNRIEVSSKAEYPDHPYDYVTFDECRQECNDFGRISSFF